MGGSGGYLSGARIKSEPSDFAGEKFLVSRSTASVTYPAQDPVELDHLHGVFRAGRVEVEG